MVKPSKETVIRYLKGNAEGDEKGIVELYLSMDMDSSYLEACIREVWQELDQTNDPEDDHEEKLKFYQLFESRKLEFIQYPPNLPFKENKKRFSLNLNWINTIAAALILVSTILYLKNFWKQEASNPEAFDKITRIEPHSDQAELILPNGDKIPLSEQSEEILLPNVHLRIEKNEAGEIIYRSLIPQTAQLTTWNTINTPIAGRFQIILPDGSKAILNAASSIRYPQKFPAHERRISMKGEVYFEIEKVLDPQKRQKPFIVETDKQEIQVLGTKFNVNAYSDEPFTSTTLVEGSVQVKSKESAEMLLLKPGQEARLGNSFQLLDADLDALLAWKSGDFYFHQEDLSSVSRKLSRWYGVDISYPKSLQHIRLTGIFSKSSSLSTIIESLKNIHTLHVTYLAKERRIVLQE